MQKPLLILCMGLCLPLASAVCSTPAAAGARFDGLQRLYFERADADHKAWKGDPELQASLPKSLTGSKQQADATTHEDEDADFRIRDFELPIAGAGRVVLREVEDRRHPRIFGLWWALYDSDARSELWFYTADPVRNDGKLLSNYRIDHVQPGTDTSAQLRVHGSMLRPGGAWWLSGLELELLFDSAVVRLGRVRSAYAYSHSYDSGDASSVVTVQSEQRHRFGFERKRVDPLTTALAQQCGFADPDAIPESTLDWNGFERAARCITADPTAEVSLRLASSPPFAERPKRE